MTSPLFKHLSKAIGLSGVVLGLSGGDCSKRIEKEKWWALEGKAAKATTTIVAHWSTIIASKLNLLSKSQPRSNILNN